MFRKKKAIVLYEKNYEQGLPLSPISQVLPSWYKSIHIFGSDKKFSSFEGITVKGCAPFMETMMVGYNIPLISDIVVEQTENGPRITWRDERLKILKIRNSEVEIPAPLGYHSIDFAWSSPLALKVPKGYRMLITHPFNRYDLPFITTSGIVEGGYPLRGGNLPVFISKTFEGIIPKGTPIAQMLPFKVEDWNSKVEKGLVEESDKINDILKTYAYGWYRKNIWKKSQFG
jgi:hypothetical protein